MKSSRGNIGTLSVSHKLNTSNQYPQFLEFVVVLGKCEGLGCDFQTTKPAASPQFAYLDHCLCPQLRAGDVVVMDNFSSHKVAGVEQRIQKCGAEVLCLPRYSPDLNPIEKTGRNSKGCSDQPRRGPRKHSTKPSQ